MPTQGPSVFCLFSGYGRNQSMLERETRGAILQYADGEARGDKREKRAGKTQWKKLVIDSRDQLLFRETKTQAEIISRISWHMPDIISRKRD